MNYSYDFIVIGSGISGLRLALEAAKSGRVVVLTKRRMFDSNTDYAQGGVAAVTQASDDQALHVKDTLDSGAGLCDVKAVNLLAQHVLTRVKELQKMGVKFEKKENGPVLTREGGHSRNRIWFSGDMTGREIEGALVKEVRSHRNIEVYENNVAFRLITKGNAGYGVQVLNLGRNRVDNYFGKATVLATGGLGALYWETTNPEVATGDGFALAYEAGAVLRDMEFVQFHPTKLALPMEEPFLISETLRGEGGILRNWMGKPFMKKYDARAEMATRDIVARAIFRELRKGKVFLDVTGLRKNYLKKRFYNIYRTCMREGLDIGNTWIPVTPAAHYSCGGILTDLQGKTRVKNVYAIGEVSSTGVHGANRLASNSMAEGLVFSMEAARSARFKQGNAMELSVHNPRVVSSKGKEKVLRSQLQDIMWEKVGIIRKEKELKKALADLKKIKKKAEILYSKGLSYESIELRHMTTTAILVTQSALQRKESRGAHYLVDHPETDAKARHTLLMRTR
ncbi:L-aspartate oxidase [Candidatus Micrarchaeota archaeon]|nr:L-aspartate oxidase [Candidatus Micrarchaeota archaeon]